MILQPPLPLVLGVLMAMGFGHLGWRLARAGGWGRSVDVAAGFIVATASVTALVHGLALVHVARPSVLRALSWTIGLIGIIELVGYGRARMRALGAVLSATWSAAGPLGRAGLIVALLTGAATVAAGLGPATDADSLAYHLAVPMEWLRYGGVHTQPYWLHMRLVGLGESLNMLGLAGGTDILGACLQLGGLLAVIGTMWSLGKSAIARVLGLLFVVSTPVLLFLVPNQKPQLLPAAALFAALTLFITGRGGPGCDNPCLAWVAVAFAMACKHSFLLTGSVVGTVGLIAGWKEGRLRYFLIAALTTGVLLIGPVWARNTYIYGDPITPNLEALRRKPDPVVVEFARTLRSYGTEPSSGGLAGAVWSSILTIRPEAAATVLGVGAFAFLVAVPASGGAIPFLLSAVAATLLIVGLGQVGARFLLEPYLWAGAAVITSIEKSGTLRVRIFLCALLAQGAAVLFMWIVGAARLLPGSWTMALRERTMSATASGYTEAKWLDRILPPDAVVLGLSTRSHALVPRRSVVYEAGEYDSTQPRQRELCALVSSESVTVVVVREPVTDPGVTNVLTGAHPISDVETFHSATRKPMSAGTPYQVRAYAVSGGCPPP